MSWQITKIEVSNFKAFKNIVLDLENLSLITLDGPNGFGKTSIFDAIELLLTGQIKRIANLFCKVMTKGKKNYDDNLFWNIRSGEKDLIIKIEFSNGIENIILARYAKAETLKEKALNRADIFSQFNLYKLPDFSSNDFSLINLRNDNFIDEMFGENFRENFCFINYLEQGQNQLLLTRVDDRKSELGNLFNISDIKGEIENCKVIERGIIKYLKDPIRTSYEKELEAECKLLESISNIDGGNIQYTKLSTVDIQPSWDIENPFPTYSSEMFNLYLEHLEKLNILLDLKEAIKNKIQNDRIEKYIEQHKDYIKSLATFGTDIKKLNILDETNKKLLQVYKAKEILQRGSNSLTLDELEIISDWMLNKKNWFREKIIEKNALQQKNQTNSNIVAELERLKVKLLEEHDKLHIDDSTCPLCGTDWHLKQNLSEAIEERSLNIANSLGIDGKVLVELTMLMDQELAIVEKYIHESEISLLKEYNQSLHVALEEERVRLESLTVLSEKLSNSGILFNYSYSTSIKIIEERFSEILALIRKKKVVEIKILPDDWKHTIESTFNTIEDFYIFEKQNLIDKNLYIRNKANEAKNRKLQKSIEALQRVKKENNAALQASKKVKKLRNTLETVELIYADHTISEIELIFHIYSGRLIQNYQRGLGLFIESGEGKQLRFLTAEKSDHDAILSMSSGQVSALSLAFFLSLNKVYARAPLILIDDPSQSLDEVNIASLTDLLRCELKHCQLIVSSHENDISSYMRYRFTKAGLSACSLNMQRLAKELIQ
ncbi:AAA family ATPase [Acinetobacter baumannii]|uniref:AAA family ATPase n=2 Tax=Acinetobacter baumannii TaxID=470 RepID=UPI000DE70474|nr:AAA family ATPase [Acinetobacter baumannii]WPQ50652.1 AAA family ATPase [Acinetobacter baumannii]SSR04197.1 recombination protein F [Acinetobacter baumannii]